MKGFLAGLVLVLPIVALGQDGQVKTYKHDQFSEDIYSAANEVNGKILQNEPGFVAGEAFGALFRPGLQDYPLKIVGIDLLLTGPQGDFDQSADIDIEIYLDAGQGPGPTNETPDFVISNGDFYNPDTNEFGIPIKGNLGYQFNFDESVDEKGVPPLVTSGNVLVMIRFKNSGGDYSAEYGTIKCLKFNEIGACGCQPVAMLVDPQNTTQTNVLHIVDPPGQCSGNNKWFFFEGINQTGGVKGDVMLRLRATTSDFGCEGSCDSKNCGDDGCGNSCGACADGELCVQGTCKEDGGNPPCETKCAGKDCGDDGCDGVCGVCTGETVCQEGQCIKPDSGCSCDGKDCGDDGCGGSCGSCADGEQCEAGKCVDDPACSCDGAECGDDGCAGSCGTCSPGQTCNSGKCEDDTPVGVGPITVASISPNEGFEDEQTEVSIVGEGFADGATVKLGGTSLVAVDVVSAQFISATVPKGMTASETRYDLIIVGADGNVGQLPSAFLVQSRPKDKSNSAPASSCSAGASGSGSTAALLLIALGSLLAIRRRLSTFG